jgi:glycosyltransferase involved in cell wall biosynthesis
MKVLICAPSYPPYVRGGGEISTQLLCQALAAAGVDVEVLATFRADQSDTVDGIRVHRVKSPNLYWSFDSAEKSLLEKSAWHLREGYDWRLPSAFARVIENTKPDLVHSSGIEDLSPKLWKLSHALGKPVVHTIRSYTLLCRSATLRKGEQNCERLCMPCRVASAPKRKLSEHVDAVIGISRYVLGRHDRERFFPRATQHVIMNIASDVELPPLPPARHGKAVLGFLGRLSREKGLERVFAALSRLPRESRPELLVAGWGDKAYERELEQAASGLEVRFLGRVAAAELFARVDALVVPSLWHEPLGRIVLEANSHGLPVLASTRGGIPEMVSEGRTGWLFDPEDIDGLARAIAEVCRDPGMLRATRDACRRAGAAYSPRTIANQHLEVYESRLRQRANLPGAAGA